MPGGDRTGPLGLGPMSGRAAGFCAGYQVPEYMNHPAPGPGAYAPGAPFAPPEMSAEQELSALRNEKTYMEDALKRTQGRIAELEKEGMAQ